MDEPTTGLDVTTEAQILDLVSTQRRCLGDPLHQPQPRRHPRVSDRVGVVCGAGGGGPFACVPPPLHPYTAGLLECLPTLDAGHATRPLKLIAGMIPDLTQVPPGCAFEPRCPHARERCREEAPTLDPVAPAHASRCFFWREQEMARHAADHAPAISSASTIAPSDTERAACHRSRRDFVGGDKLFGVFGRETVAPSAT
jgi:oligopeptide transport system ATP-binding protein